MRKALLTMFVAFLILFVFVGCSDDVYAYENYVSGTYDGQTVYFKDFEESIAFIVSSHRSAKQDRTVENPADRVLTLTVNNITGPGITLPASYVGNDLSINFNGNDYYFSNLDDYFFTVLGGDDIQFNNGTTIILEDNPSIEPALIVNTKKVSIEELVIDDRRPHAIAVVVGSEGELYIEDGSTLYGDLIVRDGGKLVIEGGDISITGITIEGSGEIIIKGGAIHTVHDCEDLAHSLVDPACVDEVSIDLIHKVNLVYHKAVAATCTTDGNEEYWECVYGGCGKLFSDAGSKNSIATVPVLPALGHIYDGWTADNDGHYHECTRCGAKLDYADHSYVYNADNKEVCEICGYVKQNYILKVKSTWTEIAADAYKDDIYLIGIDFTDAQDGLVIGSGAFVGTNVTEINMGKIASATIAANSFDGSKITKYTGPVCTAKDLKAALGGSVANLTEICFTQNKTTVQLNSHSLYGATNLKKLTIPEGILFITNAFDDLPSIEEVHLPSTVQVLNDSDRVVLDKAEDIYFKFHTKITIKAPDGSTSSYDTYNEYHIKKDGVYQNLNLVDEEEKNVELQYPNKEYSTVPDKTHRSEFTISELARVQGKSAEITVYTSKEGALQILVPRSTGGTILLVAANDETKVTGTNVKGPATGSVVTATAVINNPVSGVVYEYEWYCNGVQLPCFVSNCTLDLDKGSGVYNLQCVISGKYADGTPGAAKPTSLDIRITYIKNR